MPGYRCKLRQAVAGCTAERRALTRELGGMDWPEDLIRSLGGARGRKETHQQEGEIKDLANRIETSH